MKSARIALLALLVGCAAKPPVAIVSASLPKPAKTSSAGDDLDRAASRSKWWTRLDIDYANHAMQILPDDSGGVRAFVETGDGTTQGDWRSRASFVDVDAAGREIRNVSAIDGVQVNIGKIARGENGEVVFAGNYNGAAAFEGVKIREPDPNRHVQPPMYVVALDRAGRLAWSHTFYDAKFGSVARRSDGVVVVSGSLEQRGDFGGGTIGTTATESTFIAAFDARGNHLFSHAFVTWDSEGLSHAAFLADGTIELFANLRSAHDIDFGDGPHHGIPSLATAIVRFDDHGKCLKSSIVSMRAKDAAFGPAGDAVLTGETIEDEPNARSLVVLRVDRDGHEAWRRTFPSDTIGFRWAPVALDAEGNALTSILAPDAPGEESAEDILLFDPRGEEIYRRRMQGDGVSMSDVAFSSSGDAFIAGQTLGKDIVFDGDVLPAHPQSWVFVMKLPRLTAR